MEMDEEAFAVGLLAARSFHMDAFGARGFGPGTVLDPAISKNVVTQGPSWTQGPFEVHFKFGTRPFQLGDPVIFYTPLER